MTITTWMPLYWGDYAKDTAHLSAAHHGAYLMLIKHYWVTAQPLPDDDTQLSRIACADGLSHWRKLRKVVEKFFEISGGLWRHARVDRELVLAAKRQAKAKHASSIRWASSEHPASENAPGIPEHSPSDANHNSSLITHGSVPNGTGAKAPARDVIFAEALPWLERRSGKHCRSVVGKWLSEIRDDDAVLSLLQTCEQENPVDPVGWITARLKPPAARETWDQRRIREGLEVINAYEADHDRH